MRRGTDPTHVIQSTKILNLDILPANIDLSAAEVQLVSEVAREHTLSRAIEPLKKKYDVILIDCAPSLGLLTVNALTCADGVLIPLESEFFALRGVAMLTDTIGKVQDRLNDKLQLIGILGTMYDPRTLHNREVLERVQEAFSDTVFITKIRRTVKFPETTVAGEPITTYASTSSGAKQYRNLAKEVLARCPAA
jgi:chromosome partitioning protein